MFPEYLIEDNNDFTFNISIHEIKNHVEAHGHNFLELHFVIEGQGIEKINGMEYVIRPGTIAVIFPHQIHEMNIHPSSKVVLYNLCFSSKMLFDQDESGFAINRLLFDIDLSPITIYNITGDPSQQISETLHVMHQEFIDGEVWNNLMMKAKLIELFILLDRYKRTISSKSYNDKETMAINTTWSIIYYVYKNRKENITLKSLSRHFYLSEPYISTSFKQCLGISFHDFLRNLRLETACSLLRSSRMSVADIAYDVGFSSYSTFVRVFHSCKGMSPIEYRKRIEK